MANQGEVSPPRYYSNKEREWIFFSIVQARSEVTPGPPTDGINAELLNKVLVVWRRARGLHKFTRDPCEKTIRSIWRAFWDFNQTIDVFKRTRDRRPIGLQAIIESILESKPCSSHREVHSYLPTDEQTGRKIASESVVYDIMVNKLNLYFYRRRKVQLLTDADCIVRKAFAITTREWIRNHVIRLDCLIFSDEMMIGVNKHFNRQNDGVWAVKGKQDRMGQLTTRKAFDSLVHMWVGLNWVVSIIGPFFVDEIDVEGLTDKEKGKGPNSMTGAKYKRMLERDVMPFIFEKAGMDRVKSRFWFQQDGASSHTSDLPRDYLASIFGSRIISGKTQNIWPPRSPDLSPLDYSFWALLRKEISSRNPKNAREVKQAAVDAVQSLQKYVKRIIADFPIRLRACTESDGRQFEPWLKEYKNRVSKRGVCPSCADESTNDELCLECNSAMIRCMVRDRQLNAYQDARDQQDHDDDGDDGDDVLEILPGDDDEQEDFDDEE